MADTERITMQMGSASINEIEPTTEHWDVANDLLPQDYPERGEVAGLLAQAIADAEARGLARAKGGVRVLRLIEYVYPDARAMAEDRARWAVQGVYSPRAGMTLRSTVLPVEVLG